MADTIEQFRLNKPKRILDAHGAGGSCKAEISKKLVPLDSGVADELLSWKQVASYNEPDNWVFCQHARKRQPVLQAQLLIKEMVTSVKRKAQSKVAGMLKEAAK